MELSKTDFAVCRTLLRTRSSSLFAASLTVPSRIRVPATVIYAFCRLVDDALRLDDGGTEAASELRKRLVGAYAGHPIDQPVDRAFASVVRELALPKPIFDAFLEGRTWDSEGRRFGTFDGLLDYVIRTSGSIGICMAILMDRRHRNVLARACDLGIAIALTDLARNIGADARRGRIYLPLEWLEEAGVDVDAWIAHPHFTEGFGNVTSRLLHAAETYYRRADPGLRALPFDCQPTVRAARYIYSAIGDGIERAGFDSVSQRSTVSAPRKAQLLVRAVRRARSEDRSLDQTPTRGADFLLDAVGAR